MKAEEISQEIVLTTIWLLGKIGPKLLGSCLRGDERDWLGRDRFFHFEVEGIEPVSTLGADRLFVVQ